MKRLRVCFYILMLVAISCSCQMEKEKKGSVTTDFPGTPDGAKALLEQFVQPGVDKAALSKKLRPKKKDFQAVFVPKAAARAEEGYRAPWEEGKIVIGGREEQKQVLLMWATSEELKKGEGKAQHFPGGYAKVVPYFKDGVTWYRFKFVRPGETIGYAWDGLVYVNGHWVIFPKPWRVLIPSL